MQDDGLLTGCTAGSISIFDVEMEPARLQASLSGILCAMHSMTRRSMYAKQEDDEGGRGRGGEVADHPQGAH
jgi:hypothetical protein